MFFIKTRILYKNPHEFHISFISSFRPNFWSSFRLNFRCAYGIEFQMEFQIKCLSMFQVKFQIKCLPFKKSCPDLVHVRHHGPALLRSRVVLDMLLAFRQQVATGLVLLHLLFFETDFRVSWRTAWKTRSLKRWAVWDGVRGKVVPTVPIVAPVPAVECWNKCSHSASCQVSHQFHIGFIL